MCVVFLRLVALQRTAQPEVSGPPSVGFASGSVKLTTLAGVPSRERDVLTLYGHSGDK